MFVTCSDPLKRHKVAYTSRRYPRRNFRKVNKKVASESRGKLCEGSYVCTNCFYKFRHRSGSPDGRDQSSAERQEDVTVNEEERSSTSESQSSSTIQTSHQDVGKSPMMTPTTASQSLEEVLPGLDITPVRKRK